MIMFIAVKIASVKNEIKQDSTILIKYMNTKNLMKFK